MRREMSRVAALVVTGALVTVGTGCGSSPSDQITSVSSSANDQSLQMMSSASKAQAAAEDKAEAKAGLPPDEPTTSTK